MGALVGSVVVPAIVSNDPWHTFGLAVAAGLSAGALVYVIKAAVIYMVAYCAPRKRISQWRQQQIEDDFLGLLPRISWEFGESIGASGHVEPPVDKVNEWLESHDKHYSVLSLERHPWPRVAMMITFRDLDPAFAVIHGAETFKSHKPL